MNNVQCQQHIVFCVLNCEKMVMCFTCTSCQVAYHWLEKLLYNNITVLLYYLNYCRQYQLKTTCTEFTCPVVFKIIAKNPKWEMVVSLKIFCNSSAMIWDIFMKCCPTEITFEDQLNSRSGIVDWAKYLALDVCAVWVLSLLHWIVWIGYNILPLCIRCFLYSFIIHSTSLAV